MNFNGPKAKKVAAALAKGYKAKKIARKERLSESEVKKLARMVAQQRGK
jgi:DNA-binding NarL/FixJ family response regulator